MYKSALRPLALIPFLASLLVVLPATAPASVITTGCANVNISCTLPELMRGGAIQADQLVFDGFTPINVLGFTAAQYPNINFIEVFGVDDGGLDPGPGLRFVLHGQWNVSGAGLIDFETTFNVTTTGSLIKDSSVDLAPGTYANGPGSMSGVEDYLFESAGGNAIYRLVADIRPSDGFNVVSTEANFAPMDSVHGVLTFRVNGGGAGSAYLEEFTLRFSQQESLDVVPEPNPFSLLLTGVLAMLWVGRKFGSATGNRTRA